MEGKIPQGESNFELAGPMTETILLGVLAQRNPDTRLEWDAESMQIKGHPELQSQIRREYRKNWTLTA